MSADSAPFEMSNSGDAAASTKPCFVLIHGTWGRRSAWTFPEGPLHRALAERFPDAAIRRFEWSGSNSHRARFKATDGLRESLEQHADVPPTILIGHSHGGTIVERMADLYGSEAHLSTDRSRAVTGAVTVGTPSLSFRRVRRLADDAENRPVLGGVQLFGLVTSTALSLMFLVAHLQLGVEPVADQNFEEEGPFDVEPLNSFSERLAQIVVDLWTVVGTTAAVLVGAFAVAAVLSTRGNDGAAPPSGGKLPTKFPVVAIRTRGDEAARLLGTGRVLGAVVERFRIWSYRARTPTLVVVASLVGFAVVGASSGDVAVDLSDPGDLWLGAKAAVLTISAIFAESFEVEMFTVALAAGALLPLIIVASVLASMLEALLYGSDGIGLLRRGRVLLDLQTVSDVRQIELSSTHSGRGLRHSRLMEDPVSVAAIVDCCSELLRRPPRGQDSSG